MDNGNCSQYFIDLHLQSSVSCVVELSGDSAEQTAAFLKTGRLNTSSIQYNRSG